MSPHLGFLYAILETPDDPEPRLIYADWLEEQGDPVSRARAEYLRVECALAALPRKDATRRKLRVRLRELQTTVGNDWWRALDCARVEECIKFAFRCPQRWDTLLPTAEESIRHCSECGQDVYYCHSVAEARDHASAGHCVAVDTRALRLPGDLRRTERRRLLGRVAPQVRRRIPLPERRPTGLSETE
jgi:uncharacterized protein (TIGR02996 family)